MKNYIIPVCDIYEVEGLSDVLDQYVFSTGGAQKLDTDGFSINTNGSGLWDNTDEEDTPDENHLWDSL